MKEMHGLTIVIPVYGVLMESLGRKVAMLTAGIFYGLGTILCACSGSMYQLIAARAVAGVRYVLRSTPSYIKERGKG